MLPILSILHPTDFSRNSEAAFQFAKSLARDYSARLIVLHVLNAAEPPDWLDDRMAGEFPWTEDCHQRMERILMPLRNSNPDFCLETRVTEGLPALEILRVAEADGCDLIVMGTHGRTGLDRVLMGSVAEEVMRKALCPVLVVRDPLPSAGPIPSADDPHSAKWAEIASTD